MEFIMKCYNCKKEYITNDISYIIPGGIRGCGPSITIYFCSQECLIKFKKTSQCQVCKCTNYDKYIIDDVVVCADDSSFMERPTCREKYTNEFICDFCDLEKISDIYKISNDEKLYTNNEEYVSTLLLCHDCFDKYDNNKYIKRYIYDQKFNVKEIDIDNPNYHKILCDYKIKISGLNICNIKRFIEKIKNENEDEFNELYNFFHELKISIPSPKKV
jgi:hypothetical protein